MEQQESGGKKQEFCPETMMFVMSTGSLCHLEGQV
jgi:hypothetical protein